MSKQQVEPSIILTIDISYYRKETAQMRGREEADDVTEQRKQQNPNLPDRRRR